MGGPGLETVRMALYVSFPILMFYLANSPSLFRRPISQATREEDKKRQELLKQEIKANLDIFREFEKHKEKSN
ncbi:unnamed protein product [Clavelina lepadiformis]|uniref:Uncharacterized protein n=1 Tax=Clavelina lepadiformis TaxID=159417 RepID=A0ABP0GG32_CLALP